MPTIEARLRITPRRALDLLRQDRRLRRAAKLMPKPAPWDWAKPRIMPLLAGPYIGSDPLVTVVGPPGCAVIFGIGVAGTFAIVDRAVAERWEVSDEQFETIAYENLDRRAARLDRRALRHGTLCGRIVRILDSVPWASSLVLAPEQLQRIFGAETQLFGTPRRETLVAIPVDTPVPVAARIVVDLEMQAAYPLLLDPFLLDDGRIVWESIDEDPLGDSWAS